MAKNHYYLPDAQERGQDHTESTCRAKNGAKDSYRDTERKRKWKIRMDQLLDVSLKKVIIEDPKVAEFLEDQRKERNFSLSSINEPQLYKRTKNEHKHAEEEEEQEATGTL